MSSPFALRAARFQRPNKTAGADSLFALCQSRLSEQDGITWDASRFGKSWIFTIWSGQKKQPIAYRCRKHKDRIHAKINAANGEFLVDMAVKGQGITFIQGRYLNTVSIFDHANNITCLSRWIIAYSLPNPAILVTYAPYSVIAEMTPINFLVLYLASASAILFCATTVNTQGLPI